MMMVRLYILVYLYLPFLFCSRLMLTSCETLLPVLLTSFIYACLRNKLRCVVNGLSQVVKLATITSCVDGMLLCPLTALWTCYEHCLVSWWHNLLTGTNVLMALSCHWSEYS